ncbi:winged helix-turn-helix transcriptional regulator [Hydrotalea sp.]|uniref:winged helix-turn-helix transcriptional regulator n=1 Tax=Hydrotalea sp. TaxID=2881279 RepID=UPI003D0D6D37
MGGTWKIPILWRLRRKTFRYGELKNDILHVSHKILISLLKVLEDEGFINRIVYAAVPPKVEYSITERGLAAINVIEVIRNYGIHLMQEFGIDESIIKSIQ